jgi:hypothetical protein
MPLLVSEFAGEMRGPKIHLPPTEPKRGGSNFIPITIILTEHLVTGSLGEDDCSQCCLNPLSVGTYDFLDAFRQDGNRMSPCKSTSSLNLSSYNESGVRALELGGIRKIS